ncbi:MAG: hypothetical protein WCT77_07855, partial [Bacteroidota bacterium]
MKHNESMYPDARIPYGTWGSSYFPAWQMSPIAEVNIGQFAGEAMSKILSLRKISQNKLDYLVSGSTIPWHWKFWNSPFLTSCMGQRLPGYHIEQACATGLKAILLAASEVQSKMCDSAGVLTFDRTSDSPVGVFPERRSYERTIALSDVWDNFGFDPSTGGTMLATAGNAARKHKIDKKEVDEIAFHRHSQYFQALNSGFLNKILVPLEVLNLQGKVIGIVDSDAGVRQLTMEGLSAMKELDSCITGGTQTHASDGMATLLVTSKEKVKEFSTKPEIDIQFIAKAEVRVQPGLMPEAPAYTVQKLLDKTGMSLDDICVIKNHNPFAVNDAIFAKVLNYDWHKMNKTGCPLVWGHPQG